MSLRLLVAIVLLGGCSERRSAAPPPMPVSAPAPAAPAAPADFTVYGDCRSDHDIHRRICASMLDLKTRFVLVAGDLVDWGRSEEDWGMWRLITRDLRAKAEYLAAAGNHDVSQAKIFEREFGLERRYYDRRIDDVHVFILDSNDLFEDAEQRAWLEERAKASDAKHKIAVFHHPPFHIDPFGDFEALPVREKLHPILVRHRFCAAFCGHHHVFYATKRDGVRYVVSAGGGAVLYELDPKLAKPGDVYRRFHHFVACRIEGKGISARVCDPDGREVPELSFTVCEHN